MTNLKKVSLTRTALLLAAFVLTPGAGAQTTWYVADFGSCDTGTGTLGSSTNPYCSIQDAIIAADHGDTVQIAAGGYNAAIDLMGKQITLRGAGQDYTTLIGNALDEAGIICTNGETPSTVIEDLTVSYCAGRLETSGRRLGGGMYIKDSSPTIRNVTFSYNYLNEDVLDSGAGGGGIYLFNSNSLIEDCTFQRNIAGPWDLGAYSARGGAIYNEASTTTIIGCLFYDNWVDWGKGGAIYNGAGSDVYIEGCTFISNVARADGSTAFIGGGAGIYNEDSACEIVGSAFTWNSTAEANGGASVTNFNSSMEMRNCTVATNRVPLGATGRAILNVNSSRDITNTILYDSPFALYDSSPLIGDMGTTTGLVTYSYIYGGYSGTGFGDGNIETGILFEDLYGHDMVWGSLDDNFRIRPLSSTVDAGNSNPPALPTGYVTDYYGDERVIDACVPDTGIGFPCVDMGVHEVQSGDIIVPDDFPTIQAAIDEWNELEYCGGIMVRGGIYYERINLKGKPVTLRSESLATAIDEFGNPSGNPAFIDGESLGITVRFDSGETPDTVLEGFVILNGYSALAGGIEIFSSSPTLRDCVIRDNIAEQYGGGVSLAYGGSPQFERCQFINNAATIGNAHGGGNGGAVRNGGSASFVECLFDGNQALGGANPTQGAGGAIQSPLGTTLSLVRCTFTNNHANEFGGAIQLDGIPVVMEDCVFEGNSAGGIGGAIFIATYSALERIERCRFLGNSATDSGGAVAGGSANLILEDCEFSGNSAGNYGGALWVGNFNLWTINCAFSNNTAGVGGGAAYILAGTMSHINSIVWGNSTPQFAWNPPYPNMTATYCDIEGGYPGDFNIDEDPDFANPLGPNGFAGDTDDDLRLLSWSPCIDAAANPAHTNPLEHPAEAPYIDLDGNPRFADAPYTTDTGLPTGDGSSEIIDMGPYELQAQDQVCPADTNGDGFNDNGDIMLLIELFIAGDPAADINGDGVLDNGDLISFIGHFIGGC